MVIEKKRQNHEFSELGIPRSNTDSFFQTNNDNEKEVHKSISNHSLHFNNLT